MADIKARMNKLATKTAFKSDTEIEDREKQLAELTGLKMVKDAVKEVKDHISKQPLPQEQLLFSFMPTQMTRTSPFFLMSKRQMKDRPIERGLTWETPWGPNHSNG